ncbi:MAG: DUF1801 domain-containing protein [Bacteroidetes bacterium]|nr:DUF1801 domain-containing protein [Bacteroidota bacterium]MDA1335993.1 DUF1801 domain-containing protein [Bacteroidota bacterium]
MRIEANHPDEYIQQLPEDRRPSFERLRNTILDALPEGFEETMSYGMIGYVVPHSLYPAGYHCSPELPLPFMSIANQKHFIGFYHMGLYANPELMDWFVASYDALNLRKLDMGKSCIRFKKWNEIPMDLIGELVRRVSTEDWIATYESAFKRSRN